MKLQKTMLAVSLLLAFQQSAMAAEGVAVSNQTPASSSSEFVQAVLAQQDAAIPAGQLAGITPEDMALAFESATPEQKAQIAVLDKTEMQQTEGAFWGWILRAAITFISWTYGAKKAY